MKRATFFAVILVLLAGSGCSLAPDYTRPEAPTPAEWPTGPAYQATSAAPAGQVVAEIPWREFFLDPRLQQTIELALANNRDLRIATLNVDRYRAFYQIERAALLPQLNASASGSVQRQPADLSGTGSSEIRRQYSAGVGVSVYELDLFGRVRNLKDQALEEYFATEEAQRAAQISLIAAVAQSYLTLAADQEVLALSRQTLESRQTSFGLIQKRFNAGVISALDLHQAQTLVDGARVQNIQATRLVAQEANFLNLLVGAPLPAELLPAELGEAVLLQDIAPGVPSESLLLRPDIIQAEHKLKGTNANIGAARAAFFPRITLTGAAGFSSAELSGLFKSGSESWSFAPQIILPIFDAGRNRANLKVSKVEQEIAVAQYEKAILTAFREVADALAERGTIDEQLAALQSLTAATAESARLSTVRYEKGADSFLSVQDAQRALFVAEQNLITARLARLSNLVTLYKVLGGGASKATTPSPSLNKEGS
ncbi:MAG: multidrug transporter [Deltaproteobacteria bacterium HGW-Deltaproteobacteria-4]|nr:MAG: multidrug transporter [Deltaproteobacteria bacterium HGW-Deltaproteobacteria-4]